MRAMLWKELRENFKWAVLAMVGLCMAEFYGLTQRSNYYEDEVATLCKSAFLMVTTFGCASVGLVLGLIQILPEQRRDQWAALLHRPVPRTTIFCGKALAGFILYLAATIPPFLACIWYVVTPGHFATPFVPQMVYPGIADICAGAMYYFAALFVGLRRGYWFGTRAFGFLAAVSVSFFVSMAYYPLFRVPVEAALLMSLTLFVAGWGAILTNGKLRDQPWLCRFAVIAVVFYGVGTLGDLTLTVINMFRVQEYYYGTQYQITIEGKPLKFESTKQGTLITDLAGNPVKDKRFTTGESYNFVLSMANVSSYIGDPHEDPRRRFSGYGGSGYRSNRTYLVSAGGSYDSQAERWYYLPTEKEFVGYSAGTRQRIGAIGQNGFRPGYDSVEPLPDVIYRMTWQVPAIVQIGAGVYHNDFDQRKLTAMFSEPGVAVYGATPMESNQDPLVGLNWGAVALIDKMLVVDKTGQIIATLPYHQNMDRWGSLNIGVKTGADPHYFLYYSPSLWIDYREQRKMSSYIEEMDAKGTLLNTYTLPPTPPQTGFRTWLQYLEECMDSPAFRFGELGYKKIGALCGSERLAEQLNYTLTDGWGYYKDVSVRSTFTAFLLAVVSLIWMRRLNFERRRMLLWAVFVLAFNIAGLITFRLVADWPVRVKCPQCGRKRPVEETTCPHCQALWPVPKANGLEIFEKKELVAERVS